ncbi:MAG TPA: response regulator [Thermodesulfovibrionales bacterium]|nr:response regulator [Thermodesulfovibrionales bacterium]
MKNILVIDDNEMVLSVLSERLRTSSKDWMVLTAENGKEAVRIMESVPVDLVLTDLQMPVMDGYQFLEYARVNHPFIPIIAMTANYSAEAECRLQSLGITQVMEKPFSMKKLTAKIADNLHDLVHT